MRPPGPAAGVQAVMLGQVRTMNNAFSGLLFGLMGAIVLVYLLIVVNFQSWTDPFVIITALPGALAGIVWMLFATGDDPVGAGADRLHSCAWASPPRTACLSSAFARERLDEHGDAVLAAIEAALSVFVRC